MNKTKKVNAFLNSTQNAALVELMDNVRQLNSLGLQLEVNDIFQQDPETLLQFTQYISGMFLMFFQPQSLDQRQESIKGFRQFFIPLFQRHPCLGEVLQAYVQRATPEDFQDLVRDFDSIQPSLQEMKVFVNGLNIKA